MITEDYVSFETAKLLKEKGFNEKCIATYNLVTGTFEVEEVYHDWTTRWKAYVSAPTLQMVMKWLREVHDIDIVIEPHLFKEKKATEYCFNYWVDGHYHMPYHESYPVYHSLYAKTWQSYEEACEAAIKYCLENFI